MTGKENPDNSEKYLPGINNNLLEKMVGEIRQLVSLALGVDVKQVTPDLAFGDIPEWDSMGHMEIIASLEERYQIEVSTETISELTTIPVICRYLSDSAASLAGKNDEVDINLRSQEPDFPRTMPAYLKSTHGSGIRTIKITPVLPIPGALAGEIQSKLAYVDETIQRAQVQENEIELDIQTGHLADATPGQETGHDTLAANLEEKVQRVVQSMVRSGQLRESSLPKSQVLEDHLDRPVRFHADPMIWLTQHREVNQESTGIYSLGPVITRLMGFFERQFITLANHFTAEPYHFPTLIPACYLERVNYFRAFPHSLTFATHLREDLDVIDQFSQTARCMDDHTHPSRKGSLDAPIDSFAPIQALLSPAVCYHLYFALADKPLPGGRLAATAVGNCFRYEAINLASLERMWNFTMREIIFVGPQEYVLDNREEARQRMSAFFKDIDLAYRVESANDPFFIGEFRKQAAFQSAFQLKYEIRALLHYKNQATKTLSTLAVGSYNYHQDFFGRNLNISLEDGSAAHTGCVAFGLERIALAFMAQFGPDPDEWPEIVRQGLTDQ